MPEDLAADLNVDALLAPFAGDPVVGGDLREDFSAQSTYYRLRDARAEARAAERASDADLAADAVTPSEWRIVRQLASLVLAEQAKDLEIAAWLTEALVRGEGLAGLAVGAQVMAGLVTAFWEQGLYPAADEDGVVTRVAPVTGLNGEGGEGTLIQPLRKLTFFARPDGAPVAFWRFEASVKLMGEADPAKRKQRIAAGVQPFEDMERDARAAGAAWFAAQRTLIRAAATAWQALDAALEAAAGRDSPPMSQVRDVLDSMAVACARYAPEEREEPEADVMADPADAPAGSAGAAPLRPVETRDDMLRQLTRIAQFFRRTEPHSPLAYTLDEAVRRGRMSWPELLAEIVPDGTARNAMLVQLGIRPAVTP